MLYSKYFNISQKNTYYDAFQYHTKKYTKLLQRSVYISVSIQIKGTPCLIYESLHTVLDEEGGRCSS